MYAGRVVEELDVDTLVAGPAHPYTAALVASVPTMDSDREPAAREHPRPGTGPVRRLARLPVRAALPACDSSGAASEMPPLEQRSPTHRAACWHPLEAARIRHRGCRGMTTLDALRSVRPVRSR